MENVLLVIVLIAIVILILMIIRNNQNKLQIDGEAVPAIDCSKIVGQPYKGTLRIPGVGEIYCDGTMTCNNGKITCNTQTLSCPAYYRYTYPVYIVRRGGYVHHMQPPPAEPGS